MAHDPLTIPAEAQDALETIREESRSRPVIVFKKSPTCGISQAAEKEFRSWLEGLPESRPLAVAEIDVIAERPLARGLTESLGVRHESPQALLFIDGDLQWHDSHWELTRARFDEVLPDGST